MTGVLLRGGETLRRRRGQRSRCRHGDGDKQGAKGEGHVSKSTHYRLV
jgi:hypothetical protein